MRRFGKNLRRFNYDATIDFQGLTKSAWLAKLSGAKRRIGYGDTDGREISRWLNNELVSPPESAVHVIDRNNALLTALGIQRVPALFPFTDLTGKDDTAPSDELFAGNGLDASLRPIMLYAGETWESKTSSIDWLAALADALRTTFDRPVVIGWGGAADLPRTEAIIKRMTAPAILAPQTNLRQYAAFVSRCGLFVGPDTGPMHIAAALNVPCVGLFGATDENRNGPYGDRHKTITADVVCRPCWKRRCPLKTGRLVCLERMQIDSVVAACRRIL
jgi:ADP-heptose:LPS heptosyltransferase